MAVSLLVIAGRLLTVTVNVAALLVTLPELLVTRHRNWVPLSDKAVAGVA